MRQNTEAAQQRSYFQFVRLKAKKDIRYQLIHSTLNGAYLGAQGGRQWNILSQLGAEKGLPDLICYIPSAGKIGMVAEFKTKSGKVRPDQAKWLTTFAILGFAVYIFRSATAAISFTERWIDDSTLTKKQLRELERTWKTAI